MYKIIENEASLFQWEAETRDSLGLWENVPAINRIRDMVCELYIK